MFQLVNSLPCDGFQIFPSGVAKIQIYIWRLQENVDQAYPAVFEELNDWRVPLLVLGVQHPPHCGMFPEHLQTFLHTLHTSTLSNPVVDRKLNDTSVFSIKKIPETQVRMLEKEARYVQFLQPDSLE